MFRKRTADELTAELEAELEAARRQREMATAETAALKRELAERVRAVQEKEAELARAIADGNRRPFDPRGASETAAYAERLADVERRERAVTERERAVARLGAAVPLPAKEHEDEDTAENALELQRRALELDERARALEARGHEIAQRSSELDAREARLADSEAELSSREAAVAAAPAADPDAQRLAEIERRLAELRDAEKVFLRTQEELGARSEAVAARERLVSQREKELDEREDSWGHPGLSELEARLRRLERHQQTGETTQSFSGGLTRLSREGSRRKPGAP